MYVQLCAGFPYPERDHVGPKFSVLAILVSAFLVTIGTGAIGWWSITGEVSSPWVAKAAASIFVGYGVLRACCGSLVFEFVLDQALCYILLLSFIFMEVLSGLHLMPGMRWGNKSIPFLEPIALSWLYYTLRLFTFLVISFTSESQCGALNLPWLHVLNRWCTSLASAHHVGWASVSRVSWLYASTSSLACC